MAEGADTDVGYNNMGPYIGVGGVAVAGLLLYMRLLRPLFASILAAIAVGLGWYNQPAA